MLKRIATLLLGIGLIGLGVFFFVTPERSYALQLLTRYWPIFLILAGLVRVAGHLIDRHPVSPVGGLMISSIGGILLSANLRGEHSFIRIFGAYWFWLLLAYIIGRILRQYTHRIENGKRPHAFSPGALTIMILIVSTGIGAHFLGQNQNYLKNLNARLGRMTGVRDYLFGNRIEIEDDPVRLLALKPDSRLIIDSSTGDVKITASTEPQANVRLVKRIRTINEEEARQIARRIHLAIVEDGGIVRLKVDAAGVENDFNTLIQIAIPREMTTSIEVSNALGATTMEGLRGDHAITNGEQVEVIDHQGGIRIENPRGSVTLHNIRGDVQLLNYRRNAELREITGKISLDLKGGSTLIQRGAGPIRARVNDARLEINEIGTETAPALTSETTGPTAPIAPILMIEESRNGRLEFRNIKGPLKITAQNTRIDVDTVSGNVTIDNTSGRAIARHITGSAQIRSNDGAIEIVGVTGPVIAQTSQDITVRDFRGTLDLTTRIGSINLSTDEKLSGAIKAVNEKGRIEVSLPDDTEFRIDAVTDFGRIRVQGFDKLDFTRKERSAIQGVNLPLTPAAGVPTAVTLRTVSGDIRLKSSGSAAIANRDF